MEYTTKISCTDAENVKPKLNIASTIKDQDMFVGIALSVEKRMD